MKKITPKKSSSWFLQLNNFYPHPNPCKFCIAKKKTKMTLAKSIFNGLNILQLYAVQFVTRNIEVQRRHGNTIEFGPLTDIFEDKFLTTVPFLFKLVEYTGRFSGLKSVFLISFSIACYKLKIKINITKGTKKNNF